MSAEPAGGSSSVQDGLQQVMRAHHAAVFGYPVIGIQLDQDAQIEQARTDEANHRASRDAVAAQLVSLGFTPVAAEATYSPPARLTSAATGWQWAVALEQRTAVAYRYLLVCVVRAGTSPSVPRSQAMGGLAAAATSATYWRRLLTPDQPTVPFPGA